MKTEKKVDKSKKKKRPNRTGRKLEWEACRKLSLNFTNGETDELFSPSRGSGAIATRRRKKGKEAKTQGGDVGLADSSGEIFLELFSVECKMGYMRKRKTEKGISEKTWGPLDILDNREDVTKFEEFWLQALNDADGKEPLLIFRRNNRATCITFNFWIFKECHEWFGIPKGDYLNIVFKDYDLVILNFEYFLKWIKTRDLCEKMQYGL